MGVKGESGHKTPPGVWEPPPLKQPGECLLQKPLDLTPGLAAA